MIPTPKSGLEVAAGCGLLLGCIAATLLLTAAYQKYGAAGAVAVLFLCLVGAVVGAVWVAEMEVRGWR